MFPQLFFKHNKIVCAFSDRGDENMSFVHGKTERAQENRKHFLEKIGVDYRRLVCAKQAHGSNVACVDRNDAGKGALFYNTAIDDADTLITDTPNLPLAVLTADCLSIFLFDPQRPAIGIVHAGWKGTQEHILINALRLMKEKFNTHPKDIYAGFGPAIRNCCYEATHDVERFSLREVTKRGNRYYFDIARMNNEQLLDFGVPKANIVDSDICTSCQNKYRFSYRKEGDACGRMISVIALK